MRLCIRADGGPSIGYGHLVRTGAIAERAIERGHEVTYATTTPDRVREVCPSAVGTTTLPDRGDPSPFVEWVKKERPDVVFTDAYPVDTGYQRAVRERVPLVVYQDDASHAVRADALVNGNLYASTLEYKFDDCQPATFLGPEYAPLREAIRRYAQRHPKWRQTVERALVTFGGSDVAGLTPAVVRAFDGIDIRVDAIVGPGFSATQERAVETAAAETAADVRVVRNPDDLPERMYQADFAVSTSSSTTYELLAVGTPIVSHPVTDNQGPIAAALREHEAALVVPTDAGVPKIEAAIETYLTTPERRRAHRDRGRALVDGCGTQRLFDEALQPRI